jgi:L-asparaginase
MSPFSPSSARRIVVLGTGGTIAGTAARSGDNLGYRAAQLSIDDLVSGVPALAGLAAQGVELQLEQVAQVDSKDMGHAVWRRLTAAADLHLSDPAVCAVVATHGTDTLEETGYLLHRVLAPTKPLVLTAAMRPASALQADGPQNLIDAITVALQSGAQGVLSVLNGCVWAASEARKVHPYRLDAFTAGDAGPMAYVEEGRLRQLRAWPQGRGLGAGVLDLEVWPEVQIVLSHAGADGRIVDLLCEAGVQGLVVGCTGNGTVHQELFAALLRAQSRGVAVLRALRSGAGSILSGAGHDGLPHAASLTPAQARVDLLLHLLAARRR